MKFLIPFLQHLRLRQVLAGFLLAIALLFATVGNYNQNAMAASVESKATAQKTQEAAEKVVKEDAVKEKFGETESGDRLIEEARETAKNKLESLADKSQTESLPSSQKNFLEKVKGKEN